MPHADGSSFLRASQYLSACIDLSESPQAGRCLQVRQGSTCLKLPKSCRSMQPRLWLPGSWPRILGLGLHVLHLSSSSCYLLLWRADVEQQLGGTMLCF